MRTKAKQIILTLTILLVGAPLMQSCKKYSEGPSISLIPRAERVANTWEVENYKINGVDLTSIVSSYTETFSKKGSYSYSWGILSGAGSWSFQDKDEVIQLTGSDIQASRKLFILKLEEKSLWYYYMDGNDKYELHLRAK